MILLKKEYASPHFKWKELECKCKRQCGVNGGKARWIQPEAIEKLEVMRELLGLPMRINSAARCGLHNQAVQGSPLSTHRSSENRASLAFDCAITMDKDKIIQAAIEAGFQGIGVNYRTFVHVDNRLRRARW
mgnify:CR=1 FL=1